MKSLLVVITILWFSCKESVSVEENDNSNSLRGASQMLHDSSKKAAMNNINEFIWKQIEEHPDSVCVNVSVNKLDSMTLIMSGKLDLNYYAPKTFKLISSKRKENNYKIEDILWPGSENFYPLIKMEDLNFDGNSDISLFNNAGATGNVWYNVWLYDNESKMHKFSKVFSEISAPQIDTSKKQILSYSTLGYCEETINYYKPKGNSIALRKVIYTEQSSVGSQACSIFKKELVDNKWVTTNIGSLKSSLYTTFYQRR